MKNQKFSAKILNRWAKSDQTARFIATETLFDVLVICVNQLFLANSHYLQEMGLPNAE